MVNWEALIDNAWEVVRQYIPKLVSAIIVLLIGLWIINRIVNFSFNQMKKKKVDKSLRRFLRSFISIALKILLFITVISMLGVKMTSFVAILGAAGLAIGLSLQGSLSNFAGGVLILLFKPFKADDFIEAQGHKGTVQEIQIFNTILKTPDNKVVYIPNGDLSNDSIVNYSKEATRRIDLTIGISYDDSIKDARKALLKVLKKNKKVLKEPVPVVAVEELSGSSVNFTIRSWCNTEDYLSTKFQLIEEIKLALDKAGISIPYPQRDVHLFKTGE